MENQANINLNVNLNGADKVNDELNKSVNTTEKFKESLAGVGTSGMKSLTDLKSEFRAIQLAMSEAGKAGDVELFNKLKSQAATVKDEMGDMKAEMAAMEPDAMIKNFAALGSAMVAAFSIGSEVAVMFGASEKDAAEYTKKAMMAVQALQAVEVLRATLVEKNTLKAVAVGIKELFVKEAVTTATVAQAAATGVQATATEGAVAGQIALNTAMYANPVGIILAAVLALGAALAVLYFATTKETEAEKKQRIEREALNKVEEKAIDTSAEKISTINLSIGVLENETSSLESKKNALKGLDDVMGTNLSSIKDINTATEDAILLSKLYVTQLEAEAKTEAAKEMFVEAFKKKIKAQSSTLEENIGFFEKAWNSIINMTNPVGEAVDNVTDAYKNQQEAIKDAQTEENFYKDIFEANEKDKEKAIAAFEAERKRLGVGKKDDDKKASKDEKAIFNELLEYKKAKIEEKYSKLEDSDKNRLAKLQEINSAEKNYYDTLLAKRLISQKEYDTKILQLETKTNEAIRDENKKTAEASRAEDNETLENAKKSAADLKNSKDEYFKYVQTHDRLIFESGSHTAEERAAFELKQLKEQRDNQKAFSQEWIDASIAVAQKEGEIRESVTKKTEEEFEKQINTINSVVSAIGGLGDQLFGVFSQAFENSSIASDNFYGKEYEKLEGLKDKKLITDAEYNRRKEELDNKKAEKEKELKIKKAKQDKAAAIFSATISLAQAVIAASTAPMGLGLALAIMTAAFDAAYLATVISTPLPQFAKGGVVPQFAKGGQASASMGTDTVPAMLTPGEYVINRKATQENYSLVDAINKGTTGNLAVMIGREVAKNTHIVNNVQEVTKIQDRMGRVKNRARLK